MVNILNINKIDKYFYSWRVAFARVVGGKNTHNGMGKTFANIEHQQRHKLNTNKGTNREGNISWKSL